MNRKLKLITGTLLAPIALSAIVLFAVGSRDSIAENGDTKSSATGVQEKLVVASGSVTMDIDWSRLTGSTGADAPLQFNVAPGSFFSAIVYNDAFRAADGGSLGLVAAKGTVAPAALKGSLGQLVVEKLTPGDRFELAVRDAQTGFTYFNVDRYQYTYEAGARILSLNNARLVLSPEFAQQLGHAADTEAGTLSMSTSMYPIEITQIKDGEVQGASLPPVTAETSGDQPTFVNGPDVIVGDLPAMVQSGSTGTQVGLAIATTSCNNGNAQLNWNANPSNDHPVIPQNIYRMSANADRIEQIGQGWMKHGFTALQQNACNFGCTASGTGTRLGVGCSDPYDTGLNGSQTGIGSRAWANPFTGFFPRNDSATPNNSHTGHSHNGVSHRVLVEQADLNTTMNPGATYYGEAQYVTPHEYVWCQQNPTECNMYNNTSYRRFNVSGTTSFSFSPAAATVRLLPAIYAWTGASIKRFEPAPGQDGIGFIGYKVTGPVNGVYHYEYAVYNQNIDRAIQSFSVPLNCGVTLTNTGFRAPLNHPGSANDGTLNSAGYSNAAWTQTQTSSAMTWNTEAFATNQNANAIRWGTMYNFRFDSDRPPAAMTATIGFFKTGSPISVAIEGPSSPCAPLQLATVVSRKTHGSAGTFDIDMPLTGVGVESRGLNGDHTLVFTFSNAITAGSATTNRGSVAATSFSGSTMTVNLAGVPNAQQATVTVSGVTDSFGQTMPDTNVTVGFLTGDVNGDRSVNTGDALQARSRSGQSTDATNFRFDVNADGAVSAGDTIIVRSRSGTSLD